MADAMDLDESDASSHGVKRKASHRDDADLEHESKRTRRIKALDPDVVNKIAAGEIIVAPVHALKELIENAVDAGSTALEVLVKDGGLKLLQITDNGSGIDKEDLPILCERFTTSKLAKFEDLTSIATYGFRGEALASISHIAHLTVTTKTKDSNCAWRAHYESGKLAPAKPGQTADPKPVAGRPGTQITVEDLFHNVPTRRRAFRSASDEYNRIIDMVSRYAIHCSRVAFSCKKHGEASTTVSISAQASVIDRIRQIYGSGVANELVEFATSDDRWGFKAAGWATNANYHIKKTTLLLFINHRCVESSNIKKVLEQTYAAFLPKNGRPFAYLSLEIDPQRVDVNVHPTKKEVNFLNEDEIIQAICEHLRTKLATVDSSRTFMTQTLLPGGLRAATTASADEESIEASAATQFNVKRSTTKRNENSLVRTDTNLRKITSMLPSTNHTQIQQVSTQNEHAFTDAQAPEAIPYEILPDRGDPVPVRLQSIKTLRTRVRDDIHNGLTEVFASHTFVGIVDDERRRLAAIQGGVKLYLVDYGRACFEYLYQVGLTNFANFGLIRFQPPLDLREILTIAAEHEKSSAARKGQEEGFNAEEVVEAVASQLIERREMLAEYFSLEISPSGELLSIPLLVKMYTPSMAKLPTFLLRLGPYVDWTDEERCFDTFLRELASFYAPEQLPPESKQSEGEDDGDEIATAATRQRHIRWAIEHVFFPAFKARLVATKGLMRNGVLEVANLKGLYRVFERC